MRGMTGIVGTACLVWAAAGGAAETGTSSATAAGKPADQAATVAAERGPFEARLELKGTFEPVEATVLADRPESFGQPLEILSLVPHGGRVAAGDVIVAFAADKIDRAIVDLDVDLAVGEKSLELSRRELAAAERTTPLDLADAERQDRLAKEDLARFTEVGRSVAEEGARFGVQAAEQRLRSAQEELAQLEKMYRDKDLTEETEEMILQRTRFDVTAAERFLRQERVGAEDALALDLPRKATELERAALKASHAMEKARATLPLELERKRLGVAKLEHEQAESRRKREELVRDRGLVTVKSPHGGIVYYGRLLNGTWSTDAVAGKAVVGQLVPLGELVFTVVGDDAVRFRARLEEQDVHLVAPNASGQVVATGYPDAPGTAALEAGFTPIPRDGKYEAVFTVTPAASPPPIRAGMTGTVRLVVRSRPDAITLPDGAVFREADGSRVVYVEREAAPPAKRTVKIGLTSGGRTEILEGLAAGDRVRTSKP